MAFGCNWEKKFCKSPGDFYVTITELTFTHRNQLAGKYMSCHMQKLTQKVNTQK